MASTATSTGLRFALGAFNAVGIILGPALAAWSIFGEIKKVKAARRELESTRAEREAALASYAARTRRLQKRLANGSPAADSARAVELRPAGMERADGRLGLVNGGGPVEATRQVDLSRPARQSYSTPPASDS